MATTLPLPEMASEAAEEVLTTEQKVSLLWRSIMGYGYGDHRVPGLLEQSLAAQKKTEFLGKLGLSLLSIFGLLANHGTIGELVKVVLASLGGH